MTEPLPPSGFSHQEDPRAERVALVSGLLLAVASLGTLGMLLLTQPMTARHLALQWVAHTALGKETSVPTGLALGVDPLLVTLASFAQDAVVLLVGYPLVLLASRGALRWKWLGRVVRRPHPRHAAFARRTEGIGVAALALSVWIPYLPSGGLVAALIGRAAGYRPRVFLPALTLSALLSAAAYTYVYVRLATLLSPRALWMLVGIGAAVSVALVLLARMRARRAERAVAQARRLPAANEENAHPDDQPPEP